MPAPGTEGGPPGTRLELNKEGIGPWVIAAGAALVIYNESETQANVAAQQAAQQVTATGKPATGWQNFELGLAGVADEIEDTVLPGTPGTFAAAVYASQQGLTSDQTQALEQAEATGQTSLATAAPTAPQVENWVGSLIGGTASAVAQGFLEVADAGLQSAVGLTLGEALAIAAAVYFMARRAGK